MGYMRPSLCAKCLNVNNGENMATLGNDEVESSILSRGTSKTQDLEEEKMSQSAHNARPLASQGGET